MGGGIKESFAVTPKPEQMPEFKGQQAYATDIGKEQAAKEIAMPKTTASFNSAVAKSDRVSNLINEITPRVGSLTAGFGGSLLSKIPGTGASDLKANLDTLEANMGFNELQEMRNNSPTGGALGAVSERELILLTSAVSNVRQSQSPKQLRENLSKLNQELQNSKQRIVEAYNQDKARFGANAMPSINGFVGNYQNTNQTMQQPSNNYQEGMTATHPTTGQKLIFRGGQWQDM